MATTKKRKMGAALEKSGYNAAGGILLGFADGTVRELQLGVPQEVVAPGLTIVGAVTRMYAKPGSMVDEMAAGFTGAAALLAAGSLLDGPVPNRLGTVQQRTRN